MEVTIIKELIGKTLVNIEQGTYYTDTEDEIIFKTSTGEQYKMYHQQDCCESVSIDDVNGNYDDLLNTPLLVAEERSENGKTEWGTETWTFYEFRTIKGSVNIKWYGGSNGYYSEDVEIIKI